MRDHATETRSYSHKEHEDHKDPFVFFVLFVAKLRVLGGMEPPREHPTYNGLNDGA